VSAVATENDTMTTPFRPGDSVFWWARITRAIEFPILAEIAAIGAKRITILAEDPAGGPGRVIRHVTAARLQPVALYHEKAIAQGPRILEPAASWGRFTRYLEVGADLRAVRHVDVFENRNMLCYDRSHWVDDFGMLANARINRNRKQGPWGLSEEITGVEFEHVWSSARRSPLWRRQKATALMSQQGKVPTWLTIRGWRPSDRKKRRGS
jgi:hypothetical protein